jgi:hypothetical protein
MHVSKKKKIKIKEKKNRAYAWSKLCIFPQHSFNNPSNYKKKKKTQIRKTTAVSQPTAVMKKREHYFKNIITFY